MKIYAKIMSGGALFGNQQFNVCLWCTYMYVLSLSLQLQVTAMEGVQMNPFVHRGT